MNEYTVKFTGWKAAVLVIGLIAFVLVFNSKRHTSLDRRAAEVIRPWVAAEYHRALFARVDSGEITRIQAGEMIRDMENIQIDLVKSAGISHPVACVKISVGGAPPPDGKAERCFRLDYSILTGWTYARETGRIGYYLALAELW